MKKLRLIISYRFWQRRVRAFDKNKAKAIKELRNRDIEYLERYYNDKIRRGVVWVNTFDMVKPEERLRIMNSRLFAEWIFLSLGNEL